MPSGYPLLLDLSERLVVIVGGGPVAARKAAGVIEAGARGVKVVSPRFCEAIPKAAERVEALYVPEHLDGAGLVFAATDSARVNDAVVADARKRGVLASRADPDNDLAAYATADFTTPAQRSVGGVMITVSAGSPALSAYIRDRLGEAFDPRWAALAEATKMLRPLIKRHPNLSVERRREALRSLATEAAVERIGEGGEAGLRAWLAENFPELPDA
jgi:siroheme synthase-like protein